MNANALLLLLALCSPAPGWAQGFAGLGTAGDGFAVPERGHVLHFPQDHGAHPDFRIEWWYLTATLQGADGTDYGVQWTLFRTALAPGDGAGWDSPQVWMGHAALTTPEAHLFDERLARGGIGQAGVTSAPFDAWIDDWRMVSTAAPGRDALSSLTLSAAADGFSYDLALTAQGPLVAHGDQGYSVKSAAGQASYYYSQPFYTVEGELQIGADKVAVTGQAWLDREWSSQPLAADQTGWDWFSLVFDSGARLMGFRLRDAGDGFTSATWIAPDGTPTAMPPDALQVTPLQSQKVAGREIPIEWQVQLAAKGVDVMVSAVNSQAFMDTTVPYWEGPIRISGTHRGRGYLEMTGYD